MSVGEMFPAESLLDDSEIDEIIAYETSLPEGVNFDALAYESTRRKLIGPIADICHPEFGRPNRPEETFAVFYKVTEEVVGAAQVLDEDGRKDYEPIHRSRSYEYIFTHDGIPIDIAQL